MLLSRKHKLKITALAAFVLLFALTSCSKKGSTPNPGPTPAKTVDTTKTATKPAYSLVWSDEFDGTSVDTSKWNFETGGGGWGNNELEYYQAANATVGNGNLMITAKLENAGGEQYTSARMTTLGKEAPAYGRIEARIKVPMGPGFWPAFWMLGSNIQTVSWPTCGEMDIMEHINDTGTIYGTMHWAVNGQHSQYGSTTNVATVADYHVYAIEWDQNEIRWYVDSNLYQTGNIKNNINSTGAFHLPFFIILNFALGGSFPNAPVNQNLLPATMYVDYVRVYKQTN